MALISSDDRRRIEIPHEPGHWVEIQPLTVQDTAEIERAGLDGEIGVALRLISRCLVAWSYDVEPTEENIGRLDMDTFRWLMESVDITSGRRSEDEKKVSASNSQSSSQRNRASRRS